MWLKLPTKCKPCCRCILWANNMIMWFQCNWNDVWEIEVLWHIHWKPLFLLHSNWGMSDSDISISRLWDRHSGKLENQKVNEIWKVIEGHLHWLHCQIDFSISRCRNQWVGGNQKGKVWWLWCRPLCRDDGGNYWRPESLKMTCNGTIFHIHWRW